MTELPSKLARQGELLADVQARAADVRAAEADLDAARAALRESMRAAHDAGASFALIGQALGLSRQRVARIVRDGQH